MEAVLGFPRKNVGVANTVRIFASIQHTTDKLWFVTRCDARLACRCVFRSYTAINTGEMTDAGISPYYGVGLSVSDRYIGLTGIGIIQMPSPLCSGIGIDPYRIKVFPIRYGSGIHHCGAKW